MAKLPHHVRRGASHPARTALHPTPHCLSPAYLGLLSPPMLESVQTGLDVTVSAPTLARSHLRGSIAHPQQRREPGDLPALFHGIRAWRRANWRSEGDRPCRVGRRPDRHRPLSDRSGREGLIVVETWVHAAGLFLTGSPGNLPGFSPARYSASARRWCIRALSRLSPTLPIRVGRLVP
jgi:hypothetical protein